MHKPESVKENEIYKILWDFEIQTNHLILPKGLDPAWINKKKRTCYWVDFNVQAAYAVKIKER